MPKKTANRRASAPPPASRGRRGRLARLLVAAGVLALALAAVFLKPWHPAGGPQAPSGRSPQPVALGTLPAGTPVLFLTIDTLREDHLGRSGYARETTPFLDSLAAQSVYFSRCFSQSPWTLPSMLTLISSLPPPVFGIREGVAPIPRAGELPAVETPEMRREAFAQAHVTLAEVLRERGYRTRGVSTNGHLIARQGFTQGFDEFDETACMWGIAECALDRALAAIERGPRDSLFVWVHLFDPHFDQTGQPPVYLPAPGYETLFGSDAGRSPEAAAAAAYDRKIRYTDDRLRDFFAALAERGLLDRFLVVVAADHGEEFNEKGRWGHSKALTNTLIHVPLIVHLPGGRAGGAVVDDVVRNLDVMPTILDLLGLPAPATAEGVSLRPALEGRRLPALPVYAETMRMGLHLLCLIDPALDRKVVMDFRSRSIELYAFAGDLREADDLARRFPQEALSLAERLRAMRDELAERAILETAPGEMSEEELERLRSLGYLGGGG